MKGKYFSDFVSAPPALLAFHSLFLLQKKIIDTDESVGWIMMAQKSHENSDDILILNIHIQAYDWVEAGKILEIMTKSCVTTVIWNIPLWLYDA